MSSYPYPVRRPTYQIKEEISLITGLLLDMGYDSPDAPKWIAKRDELQIELDTAVKYLADFVARKA